MSNSPRRFYIDRSTQPGEPVVRTVAVRRSPRPATHRVETVSHTEPQRSHQMPQIGKFLHSAIHRRSS